MNFKDKLIFCGIIFFVLILSFFILFILSLKENNPEKELVECISEKAVLYTQKGCLFCGKQEDLFGEQYSLLRIVDCSEKDNWKKCLNSGIMSTPSWVLNDGTKISGVKSIEELKEILGCLSGM